MKKQSLLFDIIGVIALMSCDDQLEDIDVRNDISSHKSRLSLWTKPLAIPPNLNIGNKWRTSNLPEDQKMAGDVIAQSKNLFYMLRVSRDEMNLENLNLLELCVWRLGSWVVMSRLGETYALDSNGKEDRSYWWFVTLSDKKYLFQMTLFEDQDDFVSGDLKSFLEEPGCDENNSCIGAVSDRLVLTDTGRLRIKLEDDSYYTLMSAD